jgi:hypothetical protein
MTFHRRFVWKAFKASWRLSFLMTLWLGTSLLRFNRKWN